MEHKVTLGTGVAIGRPVHIQCSCGTAGDFATETMARAYIAKHESRLGASESLEIVTSDGAPKQNKPAPPSKVPAPPPPPAGKAKAGK